MAVVEVTVLHPAADEVAFGAVDARMQTEFAYQQPGCLRRTTARADNGDYLVLTLWGSPEQADAADRVAATDDVAREFWAAVDETTVRRRRFTLLE